MIYLLYPFILASIFITFIELVAINIAMDDSIDFSIFDPVKNYYRWTGMNWFGVIVFTLLLNIICPILSAGYWFWKLCTVGRKE